MISFNSYPNYFKKTFLKTEKALSFQFRANEIRLLQYNFYPGRQIQNKNQCCSFKMTMYVSVIYNSFYYSINNGENPH